uniref:Uncharacterized protein n=1 Tax=Cacopsylla melanoneura TaxID=428564 RepID=A0A8D8LDQ3_9HEMI
METQGKTRKQQEDSKQDQGVKPTMETQGPPPPPTSQQFAYIHAGYLPGPPYNAFDPAPHPGAPPHHPLYRGGLGGHLPLPGHLLPMHLHPSHQLHPHARYPPTHVPEDLSTPSSDTQKGLDMYYQASSHKIHELQERALKSPNTSSSSHKPPSTPGGGPTPSSPASGGGHHPGDPNGRGGPNPSPGGGGGPGGLPPGQGGPNNSGPSPNQGPSQGGGGKDGGRRSSSPPPQRHVHTHHHTHVGLGYSILAGQYPAPYGAAAVQAVINQYPPTTK